MYPSVPPFIPPLNLLVCSLPQPSLFLLLSHSPDLLLTESIHAHTSLLITSPPPSSPLPSTPSLPFPSTTALVGADVRRRACGGGGGEGVEPQSGNRSEAAQLHLAADLAARDQPDELPAHGKHPASAGVTETSPDPSVCTGSLVFSFLLLFGNFCCTSSVCLTDTDASLIRLLVMKLLILHCVYSVSAG